MELRREGGLETQRWLTESHPGSGPFPGQQMS